MYWVDGEQLGYATMLVKVLEALDDSVEVSYAFHQGMDCYWIYEEHPWYSKPVYSDKEGLKANGRLIEPLRTD